MDIFEYFQQFIKNNLKEVNVFKEVDLENLYFQVSAPKEASFGDIATNLGMVLASKLKKKPVELCEIIKTELLSKDEGKIIKKIDIVNPGFINIFLVEKFWQDYLEAGLKAKSDFGKLNLGKGEKINIEYVSANPTGPLHIGHGRGAVIGDILANLFNFMGYTAVKEYYINDAGNQINTLAFSLYYRYYELLNKKIEKPEEIYPGEYLIDIAKNLIKKDGDKWLKAELSETIEYFKVYAVDEIMVEIKEDLKSLGVVHDVFSSEKELSSDELYEEIQKDLVKRDLVYIGKLEPPKGVEIKKDFEAREQKLFRSSKYGDDMDRAIEKKNGERTYFAGDMLYHYNKLERGFKKMVVVLGADHKGYEKRLVTMVNALSNNTAKLKIIFSELVNLLKGGLPVKMSKRAGNFVTLKEVVDEIGKDVFRFIMCSRNNEVKMDFDLEEVKRQSSDNPVFYIKYSYVRINSSLLKAKEIFGEISQEDLEKSNKLLLKEAEEINLIKVLAKYPLVLKQAVNNYDIHSLYNMLYEIAKTINSFWGVGKTNDKLKLVIEDNKELTLARLSIMLFSKNIMLNLFKILGIDEIDKM